MNLVLHPSSTDRFVPTHVAKPRKRGSGGSAPASTTPSRPSPYIAPRERPRHPPVSSPGPAFTLRPIEPTPRAGPDHLIIPAQPSATTPLLTPASTSSYTSGYPFPPSDPFSAATDAASPWSYPPSLDRTPFHAPTLPSIHSIGRTSSPGALAAELTSTAFSAPDGPDLTTPFRGWNDVAAGLFDSHSVDPVLRDAGGSRWSNDALILPGAEPWPSAQSTQHAFQPFGQTPAQSQPQQLLLSPQQPPQQQQQRQQEQKQAQQPSRGTEHTIPPLPRHTYTRTLVGPLSANAQRLQDEHRKPGIFFLFQDLSIRTEGTFRLRMRLMNVGMSVSFPTRLQYGVNQYHQTSGTQWAVEFRAYGCFPGARADLYRAVYGLFCKTIPRRAGHHRALYRVGKSRPKAAFSMPILPLFILR